LRTARPALSSRKERVSVCCEFIRRRGSSKPWLERGPLPRKLGAGRPRTRVDFHAAWEGRRPLNQIGAVANPLLDDRRSNYRLDLVGGSVAVLRLPKPGVAGSSPAGDANKI